MVFIGPYQTEGTANYELNKMDSNEKYAEGARMSFDWKVVELISVDELHTKDCEGFFD